MADAPTVEPGAELAQRLRELDALLGAELEAVRGP